MSQIENIIIQHNEKWDDVKLPTENTNLYSTLMVLAVIEPASSADITERLIDLGRMFSVSDVSSYLTAMRSRGLVKTLECRRGKVGGSIWKITDPCYNLIWKNCYGI